MSIDARHPAGSSTTSPLPHEVVVPRDRAGLRVVWPDQREAVLAASALRLACRCAWCTRDRILGRPAPEAAAVRVASVEALGSYGLHIRFSDGHERGIFPWPYLDELASGLQAETERSA